MVGCTAVGLNEEYHNVLVTHGSRSPFNELDNRVENQNDLDETNSFIPEWCENKLIRGFKKIYIDTKEYRKGKGTQILYLFVNKCTKNI